MANPHEQLCDFMAHQLSSAFSPPPEARSGLDELDRRLIGALNRDGRASLRELARELGVAQGTVAARLHRLQADGILRGFIPDIDAERAGFALVTVIALRILKGSLIEVQAAIAEHPAVYGVYDVTGEWDSIVLARFGDRGEMDHFIKHALALSGVERTNTHVVLNTVKEERRVPV